jgi:riboflavin kinase/FMN adenylyltransferase
VVCIGAFDGLHRGHRALVGHAVARARALGVDAVALSFEPLPREYFAGSDAPPRLSLPRAKFEGLRALGADRVGLLRFDAKLVALDARDFVERVLVQRLAAREVWVGPEFRFGKGRGGDLALLKEMGERHGFVADAIAPIAVDGERVSSSRIRSLLGAGELDAAAKLLGGPYAISGKVVRGAQLGRKLGFPTANLRLGGKTPALGGIFATRVHGVADYAMPSVSSLGMRPTVNGSERLLEAHLFDFDGDLYGHRIEVEFVAKLRDELRFENLDALTAQMHRDAAQARELLGLQQPRRGAMA